MRLSHPWFFAAAALSVLVSITYAADEENKLPDDITSALSKADQIEIYSLDPSTKKVMDDANFQGYKVFGKTTVKGNDARKIVAALHAGIKENTGVVAGCFVPRHGLRATHDGKTVDLVICFQCLQVHAYIGDKTSSALTTGSPEPLFDKYLTDANVPLAPKK